jgi:hypothetical protein
MIDARWMVLTCWESGRREMPTTQIMDRPVNMHEAVAPMFEAVGCQVGPDMWTFFFFCPRDI